MTYETFAELSDQVMYHMELKRAAHIDQKLAEEAQKNIDKARQMMRG